MSPQSPSPRPSGAVHPRFVRTLVIAAASVVGAGLVWLRFVMLDDYHAEIARRAGGICEAVAYAAETAGEAGDLQRFVAASGGNPDVRRIVVVTGNPARVLASTKREWTGELLDMLPDASVRKFLSSALRGKGGRVVASDGAGLPTVAIPFRTGIGGTSPGRLEPGAVFVDFLPDAYDRERKRIHGIAGAVFAASVLGIAGVAWALFWFHVVHPLAEIRRNMLCRARGDASVPALPGRDGEVGDLARAYGDMLRALEEETGKLAQSREVERAMRDNFMAFFDHSMDMLCVLDREGNFILANKTMLDRLGYPARELVGRSVLEVHPPERRDEAGRVVRDMLDGRTDVCRIPLQTRDGRLIHVDTRIAQGMWDGRPVLFGTCKDISELMRSEQKFAKAFHAVPIMMAVSTLRDGRLIDVNEAFLGTLGFDRDEVIGRTTVELGIYQGPDVRPVIVEKFKAEGRIHNQPMEYRTRLGVVRQGLFSMEVIEAADVPCVLTAMMDVTDSRELERVLKESKLALERQVRDRTDALREREASYQDLFEHMEQGVVYLSATGVVSDANRSAERILGLAADRIRGGTLTGIGVRWTRESGEILPVPEHPAHVALRTRKPVHAFTAEIQQAATGRKRWLLIDAVPEFHPAEESPWRVLTTLTDITELRRVQNQLGQAQKLESIGRLAGGIAHDFNNCLYCVLGYAEMIAESLPANGPHRAYVEQIVRAARQASDVTKQLLAFSRRQVLMPRPEEINRLVENQIKMLRRLIGEDVRIDLALQPGGVVAVVDPSQFQQVVMNLCINARDAMPRGGVLTLHTRICGDVSPPPDVKRAPDGYVCLAVSDTGTGMTDAVLSHIFEPFFTTKEAGSGTGLGLAVIHGIVRQHGGWIAVESQDGKGSRFDVYLPAAMNPATAGVPESGPSVALGAGESVLLVEDDPDVRSLAVSRLRGLGYAVTEAASVAEGTERFRSARTSIRVLVSDVVLPDGTGVSLAEAVADADPSVGVILTSGYADDRSRIQEIQKRGWAFLTKPYGKTEIAALLHSILHPSPPAS